jgi:hypothetical protein
MERTKTYRLRRMRKRRLRMRLLSNSNNGISMRTILRFRTPNYWKSTLRCPEILIAIK